MSEKLVCLVPGCVKSIKGKGFCNLHYQRWVRHGDPLGGGICRGETQRFIDQVVLAYDGEECLIWPYGRNGQGYAMGVVDGAKWLVHRYVCKRVHGDPPTPDHQAAHSCGKGHLRCVTKGHLSWKTMKENHADKFLHGTNSSVLTANQAREILSLKGTASQTAIAAKFGLSQATVSSIHRRRIWAWL